MIMKKTAIMLLFIICCISVLSAAEEEGLGLDIGGGISFELSDRFIDGVISGDVETTRSETELILGSSFKLGLITDIYYRFNDVLAMGVETGVFAFGVSNINEGVDFLPVFDIPLRLFGRFTLGFIEIQVHGGYNFNTQYDFNNISTSQAKSALDYALINNKFDVGATLGIGPVFINYSYLFWLDGYLPYEDSHKATLGVKLTLF